MIVPGLILLAYLSLVLEIASGSWPLPAATAPQFLYLAAAVAALNCRGGGAIVWAVIAGLLADVAHGSPLGGNVVLLANLTFLAQLLGARQRTDSAVISAAFVLLYVAVAGFSSVALQNALMAQTPEFRSLSAAAISRAGGTAAIYVLFAGTGGLMARSARLIVPRRTIATDRPNWAR